MATDRVNRKALALLLLVFALGIALGVVGTRLVSARAFAARTPSIRTNANGGQQRVIARLTQDLSLSQDQQKQVGEILSDMQSRYNAVRQNANPQYEEIRNQGHDQIRQILTPDQRPKFEAFLERVQEERRNRENQNQNQNSGQNR